MTSRSRSKRERRSSAWARPSLGIGVTFPLNMLTLTVYPILWMILWGAFLVFLALMIARMIFSYADPNPFGTVGRIGFKIRRLTEKSVYPSARLLASFRVDTRYAPLVSAFVAL